MAFTIDRNEAAARLGVSTRTVDRHIQANRIRTRRIGKRLFLEEDDVEIIRLEETPRQMQEETIEMHHQETLQSDENAPEILPSHYQKSQEISADAKVVLAEFSRIYSDAQEIIAQKDETIKDLSYKLGKAESELKNSVDAAEYRRTTHLLESTKSQNEQSEKKFSEKIVILEKEVKKKNSFIIGMAILFVLVVISSFVFLILNRF